MKINKKSCIEIGIAAAIFAAVAAVAAVYDLAINQALYFPGCLYAQYFAKLGELPSYLTPLVVAAILFYQDIGRNKNQKIIIKVFAVVIAVVGAYFAFGKWFWKNFMADNIQFAIVYKLIFAVLIGAITIGLGGLIPKKHLKTLFWFALFLAIAVAVSNVIVQIMKIVWARQRFRTMVDVDKNAALNALYGSDFAGFAPWYKPELLFKSPIRTDEYIANYKAVDSDTFKSFPSGHTVAASASFGLIILPDLFPKLAEKNRKWIFWTVPIAYTAIVALSRILMGAHYLSDVLFGGYVGATVACLTRYIMARKVLPKHLSNSFDTTVGTRVIVLGD